MTQTETVSTVLQQHALDMMKQNIEMIDAMQKQLLDALEKANQGMVGCLHKETELTAEFAKKMATAVSIPEATAAYQAWISAQIELSTRQARNIFEDTKHLAETWTRIISSKAADNAKRQ